MAKHFHVGEMITQLLQMKYWTKADLGRKIGISASNAVHLTTRASVDVVLLQKVGNALRYNFFQHFPIDDGKGISVADLERERQRSAEKDKAIEALKAEVALLKKEMEETRLKQENEYLREMNDILKSTLRPSVVRLRPGQQRKKSLGSAERLMIGEGKLRRNEE